MLGRARDQRGHRRDVGAEAVDPGVLATSPPATVVRIDRTIVNECKTMTFAPLASDVMLAVYGNGGSATVLPPKIPGPSNRTSFRASVLLT